MLTACPRARMSDDSDKESVRAGKIRDWLLALLRFAVTREENDRTAFLRSALELDRSASCQRDAAFAFFTRTSTDLCTALRDLDDSQSRLAIQRQLKRIDDDRMRRALEAAIGVDPASATPKVRPHSRAFLWKGLSARRS